MARSRARSQGGFVITLELVLIFTILGIGLLVGIVAVRNALFVYWQKKQAQTVWVYDSSDPAKILGPARDFDEHEAPRLFYIDRSMADDDGGNPPAGVDPDWAGHNFRAFIGVRDDRFTTRHRLFYTSEDCTGVASCIAGPGAEHEDNFGVGTVGTEFGESPILHGGGIGYLYALQGGPSYGVGADLDETTTMLPGTLYRSTPDVCDAGVIDLIASSWTSQNVGPACAPFTIETVTSAFCPASAGGCGPSASPNCVDGASGCECPDGWYRATGNQGNNCCPIGTEFDQQSGECRSGGNLREAVTVVDGDGDRVLSGFVPPFRVNLPPDPNSFELLAPGGGGEGSPGIPTGVPYDPSGPLEFDNPTPDGVEGSN